MTFAKTFVNFFIIIFFFVRLIKSEDVESTHSKQTNNKKNVLKSYTREKYFFFLLNEIK